VWKSLWRNRLSWFLRFPRRRFVFLLVVLSSISIFHSFAFCEVLERRMSEDEFLDDLFKVEEMKKTENVNGLESIARKRRSIVEPVRDWGILDDCSDSSDDELATSKHARLVVDREKETKTQQARKNRFNQSSEMPQSKPRQKRTGETQSNEEIELLKEKIQKLEKQHEATIVRFESEKDALQEALGEEKHRRHQAEETRDKTEERLSSHLQNLQKIVERSVKAGENSEILMNQNSKLTGSVGTTAEKLLSLEARLNERFEKSEASRAAQLDLREKLVEELERKAGDALIRANDESRRIESLCITIESTNQLIRSQLEDEKLRLREEHARLAALQISMKTEAESIRTEADEARRRLRDQESSFVSEKAEWQRMVNRKGFALENERRSLDNRIQMHEIERKQHLEEVESSWQKLREERGLVEQAKRAQESTRQTLEEQSLALEEKSKVVERESSKLAKLRDEVRGASTDRKRAEELQEILQEERANLDKTKSSLEKTKRELAEKQIMFGSLRLKVSEERSNVFKQKAEALKEAATARALQRNLTCENSVFAAWN